MLDRRERNCFEPGGFSLSGLAGIEAWQNESRVDPCVTRNGTTHTIRGLGITWAGASLAGHWICGLPGELAVLFGALVTVTGPTVIRPLLERVHVKRNVATVLNSEGVIIDPIGVFIAVLCFEWIGGEEFMIFAHTNFMDAAETLAGAVALAPTQPEVYALLAKAHLEAGKTASAEQAIAAARNVGLTSAELTYLGGVILEQRGELEKARLLRETQYNLLFPLLQFS